MEGTTAVGSGMEWATPSDFRFFPDVQGNPEVRQCRCKFLRVQRALIPSPVD
jgi:hypothetical protein